MLMVDFIGAVASLAALIGKEEHEIEVDPLTVSWELSVEPHLTRPVVLEYRPDKDKLILCMPPGDMDNLKTWYAAFGFGTAHPKIEVLQ